MQHLKENERELVKLVNFFSRRSQKLIQEGKLSEEHLEVSRGCERLITQVYANAELRSDILSRREELKSVVKDDSVCPECNSNQYLKYIGGATNEKGWKCNRYRCRRCNIEFTWNRPNNPWDMVLFMKDVIRMLEENIQKEPSEALRSNAEVMLASTQDSLHNMENVIAACDAEYNEMVQREANMEAMIKDFRKYLMVEKAKMEAEDN